MTALPAPPPAVIGSPAEARPRVPRIMILSAPLQAILGLVVLLICGSLLIEPQPGITPGDSAILVALALASLFYTLGAFRATRGRPWARIVVAVANCGVTTWEFVGAYLHPPLDPNQWLLRFFLFLAYISAATVPMFMPAANRYFAARSQSK